MKLWSDIIAEEPVDEMGFDFSNRFSEWVFTFANDVDHMKFWPMAFNLFSIRLELAVKHKTYFAQQMTAGGVPVWKNRYTGVGFDPCYSFAINDLPRTIRFWNWIPNDLPTSTRIWDTDFAPYPSLPNGPHEPFDEMEVVEHVYRPRFAARVGGALKMRRIHYSQNVFLFEHVRNNWVPLMRDEAVTWWQKAVDDADPEALAAFEWCWFWTNPFGRAAASSGDALSLIVQKFRNFKMRDAFYHQDQEALLLPFDEYVAKRVKDMTTGFVPRFKM